MSEIIKIDGCEVTIDLSGKFSVYVSMPYDDDIFSAFSFSGATMCLHSNKKYIIFAIESWNQINSYAHRMIWLGKLIRTNIDIDNSLVYITKYDGLLAKGRPYTCGIVSYIYDTARIQDTIHGRISDIWRL